MNERDLSSIIVGSRDYLVWEETDELLFRQRFGGKALGLRRLCQHGDALGFSVPRFVLVPTSFFDDYLKYNNIYPEDITFENADILRDVVCEGSFSPEQSETLYRAYQSLGVGTVLIRSSSFF